MATLSGLFALLSRRHVLRTLAWYFALGYALVQLGGFLAQLAGLPDAWVRVAVVLIVALAPAAAVLSWRYDVTATGIVRTEGEGFRAVFAGLTVLEQLLFGGLTLLAFVVTLTLAVVLWPDDDLGLDASRILAAAREDAGGPKQLSYGVLGIYAPDDDPWALGRYRVEAHAITGRLPPNPSPLPFGAGAKPVRCYSEEPGCFETMLTAARDPRGPLQGGQRLLERYRLLQQSAPFSHVWFGTLFDTAFDHVANTAWSHARDLAALDILRRYASGDDAGAWDALLSEMGLFRRGIRESRTATGKRLMTLLYAQRLRLAMQLCARAEADGRRCAFPAVEPLDDLEFAATTAIAHAAQTDLDYLTSEHGRWVIEWRARDGDAPREGPTDERRFRRLWIVVAARVLPFKPNMTANAYTALAVRVAEAAALPPAEWMAAEAGLRRAELRWTDRLFNPAGTVFLEADSDLRRLIWLKHDLNTLIVLSRVVRQAALDGVDLIADPAALPRRYPWAIDPISGLPPRVDGGRLVFDRHEGYEPSFKLAVALR